jgi:hypothetical protein
MKLQVSDPVEVLIPATSNELLLLLRNNLSEGEVVSIARKYFSETKGQEYVKQVAHKENKLIDLEAAHKYSSVSTLSKLQQVSVFGRSRRFDEVCGIHPEHIVCQPKVEGLLGAKLNPAKHEGYVPRRRRQPRA